ncbi:uncharacterized protein L969DRAFT_90566 [Mixia osmundae IAM 14324]|uniref:Maintenance of telomere capping protein 1 n=1 Tax=Mixia osmundae (strain CBS 9802 / IAM 14324 / JCM 22182 / KY 12970) TaxID=764103 RepID=G7E1E2_MIXOS|nr:uncharacterized protein L969DRAFT_90566 [Mixia osmundae IAM 14324]KEI36604.1 hypothetical protein L969DRAFT_90566 [Mixia osmundae IAM 14324]GAA96652.1 hypothetical protein E5Q_03323 [Mixia osmundae IAM 14324]
MAGKATSREDVLSFLDDLNAYTAPTSAATASSGTPTGDATKAHQANDVMAFLDEITQAPRPSTPGTAAVRPSNPAFKSSNTVTGSSLGGASQRSTLRSSPHKTPLPMPTSTQPSSRPESPALSSTSMNASHSGASPKEPVTRVSSRGSLRAAQGVVEQARAQRRSTNEAAAQRASPKPAPVASPPAVAQESAGGWGWSSVWNSASTVIQQARTVAEENLHNLPQLPQGLQAQVDAQGAQAAKWREGMLGYMKSMDVDKLRKDITEQGMKTLTDLMNAVAPPISQHEVIQVSLSHDMIGYDGVETLVFRALTKVMEQVDGGDLVVNRGREDPEARKSTDRNSIEEERDIKAVQGLREGYALASASLDRLIAKTYKPAEPTEETNTHHAKSASKSNVSVPVSYCPVYMRIQPVLAPLPFSADGEAQSKEESHLYFILLLKDPTNDLVHKTLTQTMPAHWLDIPFEENEWVEDNMVEVIRRGVDIIGQEYVNGRMSGRSFKTSSSAAAAS